MGNVIKRVKIWKVLLLEVLLLVGFLTELCLYMSPISHMKLLLTHLYRNFETALNQSCSCLRNVECRRPFPFFQNKISL